MFGVGMGPDNNEKQQYQNLSGASSWASNEGKQDITQSTDFMKSILSGDPAKIGQVLGPQIRAIQGQGQQQKQTLSQFGNRGGGTNASMQRSGDTTRSSINDMVSSLTGAAVSGLNSTGQNLFNAGQKGFETSFNQAQTMHDQNAEKWNDIFDSIGKVAGGIAGMPGVSIKAAQGINSIAGVFAG